jgi:hypothetical protein
MRQKREETAPDRGAELREAGAAVSQKQMAWRRNLQISVPLVTVLRSIKQQIEAPSDSDVVRRALTAYEQFVEDTADGVQMRSVRRGGHVELINDAPLGEERGRSTRVNKVNLMFQEGSELRFDSIRQKIRATSDSEVVEKALRFYARLLNEHFLGAQTQVVHQGGQIENLRLVGLPRRPSSSVAQALPPPVSHN